MDLPHFTDVSLHLCHLSVFFEIEGELQTDVTDFVMKIVCHLLSELTSLSTLCIEDQEVKLAVQGGNTSQMSIRRSFLNKYLGNSTELEVGV